MITWITSQFGWVLGIALALALAFAGMQTVRLAGAKTEFAQYRTEVAENNTRAALQRAESERKHRATENNLNAAADKIRKERHEAVQTLNSRVTSLLGQLRNRPNRPSPASNPGAATPSPGPSGTGASLHREDAEFLVGEAAAAVKLGVERDSCIATYNTARDELAKIGGAK